MQGLVSMPRTALYARRCFAGPPDDEAIELAFSKKKIEERKAWLAGFEPGTYLDQSVDQISYSDFVNKVGNNLEPICIYWSQLATGLRHGTCEIAPAHDGALQAVDYALQ